MLTTLIRLIALLDLLFVLAAVLFSVMASLRGADGSWREILRRWRAMALRLALAGFVLTVLLILVDLMFRASSGD